MSTNISVRREHGASDYSVEFTTSVIIPDKDIAILIEMAGYGIAYWASSLSVKNDSIHVVDHDGELHTADLGVLAEKLVYIATGNSKSWWEDYAVQYLAELQNPDEREYAAGHIDADLADHVVQYALFDEIVYG